MQEVSGVFGRKAEGLQAIAGPDDHVCSCLSTISKTLCGNVAFHVRPPLGHLCALCVVSLA